MDRVDALRRLAFDQKGFDGFLITNSTNALYFSGCPGLACLLIPKVGEGKAYAYHVNYEQAKAETKGFEVELVKNRENLMTKIAEQVKNFKMKRLAVDTLNIEGYRKLAKELKGKTKMKFQEGLIWELRKVKDEVEIGLMRKAAELTSKSMKIAYEVIRPGVRECEVAGEIEYAMRKSGSWGTAFNTIVASGVRSAFPHGGCTEKEIRSGELVVVDIGAAYKSYRSDMTRTIVAGKPSEKQKKLYEIVKEAQAKAFRAVKPNVKAKEIDKTARTLIEKAGYGENFVHGLGHGVGLDVHEPPTLNPESEDRLAVGNVITIEPGIYIAGFGGIRIEDTVLVQKEEAEKLTVAPYTLEVE
ncbi:MAG: Xaa-Pro peptidase family protein [Candidatus Bathyarchaeia archaeon]